MGELISKFENFLGKKGVKKGSELSEYYHHIWKMEESLNVICLLLPRSTEDVSNILKICFDHNQPIVAFGGKTNLVGSTECNSNEVVISFEKMNKIEELDIDSRSMTVQAGVILETVQNAVQEKGLLFPLNFGAKGSAQMGGVISTNAGGMRVLRYGMTRNLILGLEIVLPDGTILNSMKKIIKDNSAYDLKQLFIGSEGTLGLITRAVLRLYELPKSRTCSFIGINSYNNVIRFLKHVDKGLAGTLSAFELIWSNTFEQMLTPEEVPNILALNYDYYVLVESLGGDHEKDRIAIEKILEEAMEKQMIEDAVLANSSDEKDVFFRIREDVHVLKQECTFDQHFDISLPIPSIGDTIQEISDELYKLEGVQKVYAFGHVADGNIHFMIGKENGSLELKKKIDQIVYTPLKALGGSVSAEHGIGLHKKDYLNLCRTEEEINVMKNLKKSLDPKNILNRGKVLSIE